METQKEHILLVENDPQVSEMIAQQTLRPLGYQVDVLESASFVLQEIDKISPDLIITNLYLPGISGKDLLVALSSQGIDIPVIVITPKGHESDALQAFRLGADNFLTYPMREAEVVNVVEDTLNQLRKRNELGIYSQQLDQINEEIGQRIHDYTEIFSIGKLAPSSASQQSLYEKLTNAGISVTQADAGWLLVFDVTQEKFVLRACFNADIEMQSMLNLPIENGLSALVAASGQVVSIHGDAVKRFNLFRMVESVLVVPIKHEQKVVGMIGVERKTAQPFTIDQQAKLEVIAEYAAILLDNSIRFQILEQRLYNLQQSCIYATIDSDIKNDLLRQAGMELRSPLSILMKNLDRLSNLGDRRLSLKQTDALNSIHEDANKLMDIADSMVIIQQGETKKILEKVDLNEVVRDVTNRFQVIAQAGRIVIKPELPSQPTIVTVFTSQIVKVIEGLLSNALKHSPSKAQIIIRVEKKDNCTVLTVKDQGEGINEDLVERLFDKKSSLFGEEARRFGGIGLSLPMMKEIISAHQGEIWVESGHGRGFTIIFSLPQHETGSD
jgi:signal transduction histidine kinase/DNA-binding response OmpR family regulator